MENKSPVERFERSLWLTARRLGPELTASTNMKLTHHQFFTLIYIQRRKECKISDLANLMEVKPSAITVMIDRLVQGGYVNRRHDEEDRRVVLVQLSEQGEEALAELKRIRREWIETLLADIEAEKLDIFLSVFESITEKLETGDSHLREGNHHGTGSSDCTRKGTKL